MELIVLNQKTNFLKDKNIFLKVNTKFFFFKRLIKLYYEQKQNLIQHNNYNRISVSLIKFINKTNNYLMKRGKKRFIINKFLINLKLFCKINKISFLLLTTKLIQNFTTTLCLKKFYKSGKKFLIPYPNLYYKKQYLLFNKLFLRFNILKKKKKLKQFILVKFKKEFIKIYKNNYDNSLLHNIKTHYFKHIKLSQFLLKFFKKKKNLKSILKKIK